MGATITRRGFVGAGAALACFASGSAFADEPAGQFDMAADVVIVGAGGAGLMAAVGAHESGASSIVLEKSPMSGGDTILSNQGIVVAWPEHALKDTGNEDSWESFIEDQKGGHWASRKGARGDELAEEFPYTQRLVEIFPKAGDWVENVAGVEWVPRMALGNGFPFPRWDSYLPRIWAGSPSIIPAVEEVVSGYDDSQILFNTEVVSLIQDETGRVIGVVAVDENGDRITVGANRGVVLASGSFNGNPAMIGKYLGYEFRTHTSGGSPWNTGDGLRMAIEAGAGTVDLDLGTHFFPTIAGSPDIHTLMAHMGSYSAAETALGPIDPAIYINMDGKRYAREAVGYSLAGLAAIDQPLGVGWYVMDATMPSQGLLDKGDGYRVQADTVEELAQRMNVDAQTLAQEIERYNGFVESGVDEDFDKPMEGMKPIVEAPFYAFLINPQHYATYGGVKVDLDSRVLNRAGEPIDGLFAAGIVTGSFAEQEGFYYSGGVAQALAFGLQAGEMAAAQ